MRWCLLPALAVSVLGSGAGAALDAAAQPAAAGTYRLAAGELGGDPLLAIDSLFYVENRGLTRIGVRLNDYRFTLVTDPLEVKRSANAFLIPRDGEITFGIGDLLAPDDEDPFDDTCDGFPDGDWSGTGNNCISFLSQGPADADAQIIIADLLITDSVAFRIWASDLQPLPARFGLRSAPNPFTDAAHISFSVPAERTTGVPVHLAVYDLRGRLVRVLVDDLRFPGTFTASWGGAGEGGAAVASGLYLVRLRAGRAEEVAVITYAR